MVAAKLGVSRSGLGRGEVTDALTADQIGELTADPPAWLVHERELHAEMVRTGRPGQGAGRV